MTPPHQDDHEGAGTRWKLSGIVLGLVLGSVLLAVVIIDPGTFFPPPAHPAEATLEMRAYHPGPRANPTNVSETMFRMLPGSFQQAVNDTLAANGSTVTPRIPWDDYARTTDLTMGWARDQGTTAYVLHVEGDPLVVSWTRGPIP